MGRKGLPFDSNLLRRCVNFFYNFVPYSLSCTICEYFANNTIDHAMYNLKPKNRFLSQHPFVNDTLPVRLLSGTINLKKNIQEFTEDGVLFVNEKHVTKCDAVILATGYDISYPFMNESYIWSKDHKIELYKYVFSPHLKHAHTLALIGLVQVYGPAIPVSEQQSRWFVQLMKGKEV